MNHCRFPWSKSTKALQDKAKSFPLLASVAIEKIQRHFPLDVQASKESIFQNLQLQVRQNYLLLFNTMQKVIIDVFEGQPSILVLIKGPNPSESIEKNQGSRQYQKSQGLIRFVHTKMENCFITFYISADRRKLLELYRIIPQTHTIQLDFHRLFKPLKKVGKGLTSTVYQALRLIDNKPVAIKAFKKSVYFSSCQGKGQRSFLKEFQMLVDCDHDSICRFQGVYETENTIYIVLEYYQKTLYQMLFTQVTISREDMLRIMQDLLEGVAFLHRKGIFHRDLKLQNIMVRKIKNSNSYKSVIIDLGLAEYTDAEEYLFQKCGTPGYVAPEVFVKGAKSAKCDIFSLGVIFYTIMFKAPVFIGGTKEELISNNRLGKMNLNMEALERDQAFKDLLMKMLDLDEENRISAEQALAHPFFSERKNSKLTQTSISAQDLDLIQQEIKQEGTESS